MLRETASVELPTSTSLVVEAKKGNEAAFNQLVSLWYQRIYNFVLKYSGNDVAAGDITQKTFISVFKSLKNLQKEASFKPWIYRIATNFCHEEGRNSERKPTVSLHLSGFDGEDEGTIEEVAVGRIYNPDKSYQQQELEKILARTLLELPEEQRSVIIMKEYEGFKFHEIADVLNTSENTIKTRLYRGLKALKEKLEVNNITKETVQYEV